MKIFLKFKSSLTFKFMLAFVLVVVPSMLIASKVATRMLQNHINRNIEEWLQKTAQFMDSSVEDDLHEILSARVILGSRFAAKKVHFNEEEMEALSGMDVDFVFLRDGAGRPVFNDGEVKSLSDEPLYSGAPFRWAKMQDGTKELAIAVKSSFKAEDGSTRILEMGSLFDIQLSETSSDEEPIALHVFSKEGDSFKQIYSSNDDNLILPESAISAFSNGSDEYFIPQEHWVGKDTRAHYLFKTVRDKDNNIMAVMALSVSVLPADSSFPSPKALFWSFFVFGTIFSGGIGFLLAKRLVRPIKRLNKGVKAIARGDLSFEMEVNGNDEIAELSHGFNLMAKQLEVMRREELQTSRKERFLMLGEVALGFAHEIRNPLLVIKTSAELVHSKLPVTANESRLLGFVIEEVGRIDKLISEFLSFAKPTPLKMEFFDLAELIEEVLEVSRAELDNNNINFSLVDESSKSKVFGDKNQIKQVVLNLILNAIDAMPNSGVLQIRIYDDGSSRMCMEVKDTGVGIPAEDLANIYAPFFSTKNNGLGLGLAKVYAIVEAHGGSISCCSKVDKTDGGTIFKVCLVK